ncbi:MAG TPA: DmsC/YnfH family molybdoenzyme membrane anchor subunit [Syntrophomonas sp.]|nr:DmsC/YnfH family molybdoenzyme membrane anchor subunit [Syntrophomonas sp.]
MEISYSLAISYLLLGTAIGLVMWYAVAAFMQGEALQDSASKVILIAFILAVVSIGFAIGHLGRMERFINLVSNPGSWLSREGFFAGAFTALVALYFFVLKKNGVENRKKGNVLIYLAALAGLCALISMGMIYATVQAVPAWNSTLVVLIDVLSAIMLGGLLFLVLAGPTLPAPFTKTIATAVFIILIAGIAVNIAYEVQVKMVLSALAAQGAVVPSIWIGTLVRVIVGLLAPAYLIYTSLKSGAEKQLSAFSIALICLVIGEIAGRLMHFVVAVKGPFF